MPYLAHPGRLMSPPASGAEPAPPSYSAEADALFAAMSVQPSDARKAIYDDFYTGFLAAGFVLSQFRQYCLAAHDSQASLLELGNPGTNTLTAVNSPTFTTDTGYQGNGTDSYLSTGIAADVFQPHMLCVASPDTGTFSGMVIGATTDNTCAMQSRNASGNAFIKIANATQFAVANSDGSGVTVGTKSGTNNLRVTRNGVSLGFGASGADSYGSEPLVVLRAGTFSTRRVSFASFGPFLSTTDAATYSDLVKALVNAINPGLIP